MPGALHAGAATYTGAHVVADAHTDGRGNDDEDGSVDEEHPRFPDRAFGWFCDMSLCFSYWRLAAREKKKRRMRAEIRLREASKSARLSERRRILRVSFDALHSRATANKMPPMPMPQLILAAWRWMSHSLPLEATDLFDRMNTDTWHTQAQGESATATGKTIMSSQVGKSGSG